MKLLPLFTLVVGLLTADIVWSRGKARYVPAPDPSPSPTLTVSPLPSPTGVPSDHPDRIQIGKIYGATDAEIEMIREGARMANAMIWTKCYEQWILAARYTENNGLTQAEILNRQRTETMTIDVEMYTGTWSANHVSKTVGYENDPFDGVVHMNRYFVNSAYMVADNLLHEDRGHSLEFHHYGVFATSEPYGANYAWEGCYNATQQLQQMSAMGFAKSRKRLKPFRPPGLRLEIRRRKMPKPDKVPTRHKASA